MKRRSNRHMVSSLIAILAAAHVSAQTAQPAAQQTPSDQPPVDTDYEPQILASPARIPATGFVMPDLPDGWKDRSSYDGRAFSASFAFVAIVDYNSFLQDSN